MLIDLIVVIIWQCIHTSTHYIVSFKHIQCTMIYVIYITIKLGKCFQNSFIYAIFCFFFFCLFWATPWLMKFPRLRVEPRTVATGLATATAMPDLSCIFSVHQSSL